MPDCLFCDLSQSRIMLHSGDWYVRYDNYPASPGHVQAVPYQHVESVRDLTPLELCTGFALLMEAADRIYQDLRPDGWNLGVNDGAAAGQTIPHLHIHLIPRHTGDQADPRGGIRRGLPGPPPDTWAGPAREEITDA